MVDVDLDQMMLAMGCMVMIGVEVVFIPVMVVMDRNDFVNEVACLRAR